MVSGLEFNEGYENDPVSDVNRMLMNSRDLATFAASFPVTAEPGTRWAYQTASSVLLGRVIRDTLTDDDAYYHFAQRELFNRLGARHSHYQADGAGNYVGGAFLYATPQRLGSIRVVVPQRWSCSLESAFCPKAGWRTQPPLPRPPSRLVHTAPSSG